MPAVQKRKMFFIPKNCALLLCVCCDLGFGQSKWDLIDPLPQVNTLNSVIYGNSLFVAVGNNGMILTSPDGTTWTIKNSGTTYLLSSVTYGNGQFVAVGDSGVILTSKADGTGIAFQAKPKLPDNGRIKVKSANGSISVILPNETSADRYKVGLFTAVGKKVFSATLRAGNGVLNIPASGFPAGIYYMSITSGDNRTASIPFVLTR